MTGSPSLSFGFRVGLVVRILFWYGRVLVGLKRCSLPELTRKLVKSSQTSTRPLDPCRVGRIVHRVLRTWPFRARCLTSSLVLYALLQREGRPAQLVIGLPDGAEDHLAHAWVEVGGLDVGPPPGGNGHVELVRYMGEAVGKQ